MNSLAVKFKFLPEFLGENLKIINENENHIKHTGNNESKSNMCLINLNL